MANGGDLGYTIVSQPGQLRAAIAAAGKGGTLQVCYQPRGGDLVAHWEHVGWMCIYAENLILIADEVDGICSSGAAKNARSEYWRSTNRMPALDHIVNYGRHCHLAFVGIARAPQDVWRRLTGQCSRMIVFRMNEQTELDAVGRLGSNVRLLPSLGEYEYLDWRDDGSVEKGGGRL
jgi:hypothetical protein